MKKYYILSEKAEIVYPQVNGVDSLDGDVAESVFAFKKHGAPFPQLTFSLKGKANFTDFISQSLVTLDGFLISPKIKDLISSKYMSVDIAFHSVTIKKDDDLREYFWMYFSNDHEELMDLKQTQWEKFDLLNAESRKLGHIQSFKAFRKIKLNSAGYENILPLDNVLHMEVEESELSDIVYLPIPTYSFYFSKRLFEELKNMNASGLYFDRIYSIILKGKG